MPSKSFPENVRILLKSLILHSSNNDFNKASAKIIFLSLKSEESSILGFNAITIRQTHERPEGMDEGTLIMTGLKSKNIINALNILIEQKNEKIKIVEDYDVDSVSVKVLRIILSYTDYINNTVWKKF